MASQTMTGIRERSSDGTEAMREAKRNRQERVLTAARQSLSEAVGEKQRAAWYSRIAEIEEEM